MKLQSILEAIVTERARQEQLCRAGKFKHTCASSFIDDKTRLAILTEEYGEIAREVCACNALLHPETTEATYNVLQLKLKSELIQTAAVCELKLKSELIQTAAVCVAWLETFKEGDV